MTPQLNSEIEAVLRALKEGRSLSEKSKWPWHVSIIEGDFLPAYGSDVFNLFKQKSETSLGSASYPCSARLWKASTVHYADSTWPVPVSVTSNGFASASCRNLDESKRAIFSIIRDAIFLSILRQHKRQ